MHASYLGMVRRQVLTWVLQKTQISRGRGGYFWSLGDAAFPWKPTWFQCLPASILMLWQSGFLVGKLKAQL